MTDQAQSLKKRIERLEEELNTQHFRGLFDNKGQDQRLKKLKKYRKQLALLEGTPIEQAVPVRNPAQAARKAERQVAAKAKKKTVKKVANTTEKKPVKKTAKKTAPKAKAKPAKKAGGAAKKATKKPAKKTAKKTAAKPAKKKSGK
jgi:hypothetical protein